MNYYFIENLTDIDTKLEIHLSENLAIKSISNENLSVLKDKIKKFHPFEPKLRLSSKYIIPNPNDFHLSHHEYEAIKVYSSGKAVLIQKREKEDFRYFVLEENTTNQSDLIYSRAFIFCDNDYFIPFSFSSSSYHKTQVSFGNLSNYTFYIDLDLAINSDISNPRLHSTYRSSNGFTEQDKNQFLHNLSLLKEFENKKNIFPTINKALNDFYSSFEISNFSTFKIIAYIACFELLIVDSNFDKLKSISSQLSSKLNLLNNQFENPIEIQNYFKGPDTLTIGKVFEAIYNYRSSIAHGDFLDFSKKMQLLETISHKDILNFVRIVLKKVLLFSLKNPELITDLKKC